MARVPNSRLTLSGEIKDHRAQLRDRGTNFSGTGLHFPAPGTVQVEGNLWVTGDFTADGKISNDALVSPVAPGVVSNEVTNFGITTSSATKMSGTISVPAGFTSAAISVIARTFALDNDTVNPTDYLYSRVTLGGVSSSEVPLACTFNGGSGTSVSPLSVVLTSLGSSIAYSVSAHSAFANWGTDALNRVSLSGSVLWFR